VPMGNARLPACRIRSFFKGVIEFAVSMTLNYWYKYCS
jgi:hypothetical protein